ncbi:sugar phosphate isomerase/epimerase [Psychromicrobium silvestre]|uniref:Sugar phosphate isomerase/epimerase n=1 Tax=Psychromicrobium silvestre TaxID=1645614 RepID=A0A7Y9LV64_9MICC|nr:sugar phosphate isomerase/epimerase family protein [Psychromicrobium silvestre]NYE96164.1 sugar phosphate isomerase/epimerase [Psychromicrobium silvestre]
MKFSVFTASTPDWTPEEAVRELAAQGWDGIEWRVIDQPEANPPGFWAGNRATIPLTGLEAAVPRLKALTDQAGLGVSGVGGYAHCGQHDDVERLLAATAALGAPQVRVVVPALGTAEWGGEPASGISYPELFEQAREDFRWVAERAAQHGVKALVELHHRTLVTSASAALRLLDGLDPAHVGVIHDLGNLQIEGHEDHLAAFQMLGPYLAHVHIKNGQWLKTGTDELGAALWQHEWAPVQEGISNVLEYLRTLKQHGYDGWIALEDFSTVLPLAERTKQNQEFLRRAWAAAQ